MEAAREAGELGAYTKAWAAQAARLGEAAPGSALLRRRLEAGMTPKTLELAVRLALCEVTPARPLPSLAAIERGLRQQTLPGATELLRQTTELLHESMQQTRETQQIATKATKAFRMTLDTWLGGTDGCASEYGRN